MGHLSETEIKVILGRGKQQHSPFLSIYWIKKGQIPLGAAYIISKTVDKRAVVRNRLRRVIKEVLRHHSQELVGNNVVVRVKTAAVKLNSRQVRQTTEELLGKGGLLKPNHENIST